MCIRDRITNYYEKIRQGKQEKLFHEVIFQIGNREDTAVGTEEGDLAVKVLNELSLIHIFPLLSVIPPVLPNELSL